MPRNIKRNYIPRNIKRTMTRKEQYEAKYPLVEIYRGYEIRKSNQGLYMAIYKLGCYGCTTNVLEAARNFIDDAIARASKGEQLWGFNAH